jgi:hypothetical protein
MTLIQRIDEQRKALAILVEAFNAKAISEYLAVCREGGTGRAEMFYKPSTVGTPGQPGDVIVQHMDLDTPDGFLPALVISAAWTYKRAESEIRKIIQTLPILPVNKRREDAEVSEGA